MPYNVLLLQKKCKRVGKGDVLPLDKSLLMGVPPYGDTPGMIEMNV
jgi:hypothetical protein